MQDMKMSMESALILSINDFAKAIQHLRNRKIAINICLSGIRPNSITELLAKMIPDMEIVNQKNEDLRDLKDLKKYENKILILNEYGNNAFLRDMVSIMRLFDISRELGIIVVMRHDIMDRDDLFYKFMFRIHTSKFIDWLRHEIFFRVRHIDYQNMRITDETVYQVYFNR